jgi:hypothetical protein
MRRELSVTLDEEFFFVLDRILAVGFSYSS